MIVRLLAGLLALLFAGCGSTAGAPDARVATDSTVARDTPPASFDSAADVTARPDAPTVALTPDEAALREKLGIPPEARTVVFFGQNAHLDIDWQKTFDDYYQTFVGDIFLKARQLLEAQPRAFYSVAEMAYLSHHLETHPEELGPLQQAVQRGQLRIVGGGMTSPDTLLPETELLLRDFLFGVSFAEDQLGARPTAAWLPDSFGHSITAPDVLAAAGYDSVAVGRIDGAPDIYETILMPGVPPKPGSTAEQLLQLGSADFVWRGAGGARVLAHFMAAPGIYCMGDNIDYDEAIEIPGGHLGPYHGDDPTYTDGRVDGYLAEMAPYTKTPYVFVPVGCDFQQPKEELLGYLDGYNQRRYPSTGAWAVHASFEDYARLVSFHKDALPELNADLSPYFMGFYGTRATLKRRVREAARPFFVAETFATALGAAGTTLIQAAAPTLTLLTRANHHDFVTGTSNDNVVGQEQLPLLDQAEAAGQTVLGQVAQALARRIPAAQGAVARLLALNASGTARSEVVELSIRVPDGVAPDALAARAGSDAVPLELVASSVTPRGTEAVLRLWLDRLAPFGWRMIDLFAGANPAGPSQVSVQLLDALGAPASGSAVARVVIDNGRVRAEWNKRSRFALTSLQIDGVEGLAGDSFLPHDYADSGGLWRMGNEMPGCGFALMDLPAADETVEVRNATSLQATVAFVSGGVVREATLAAASHALDLAITTGAAQATTRTVAFSLAVPASATLETSLAAGFAERPLEKVYAPTFWPAVEWAKVSGWAILLRQSTGVSMGRAGEVELMAARDARQEGCDIEGGTGSDPGEHRIEWRIQRAGTPADAARAAQAFNRPISLSLVDTANDPTTDLPPEHSLLSVAGEGLVTAVKPATRGDGVVVRALLLPGPVTLHLGDGLVGRSASVVDVAERDGSQLGVVTDSIVLDPATYGTIASVRLK